MSSTANKQRGELFVYISYISAIRSRAIKCKKLLHLLDSNNIKYTVIDLGIVPEKIEDMLKFNGGINDLPQLFVDTKFLGTYDDIEEWVEEEVFLKELAKAGYKDANPPPIDEEEEKRILEELKKQFPEEAISDDVKEQKLKQIEEERKKRIEDRAKESKKPEKVEEKPITKEVEEKVEEEEESYDYQEEEQPIVQQKLTKTQEYDDDDYEEEEYRPYDPNRDSDDEYY
ncbi:hypothetical protein ABK040_001128 [Willaertia magna]